MDRIATREDFEKLSGVLLDFAKSRLGDAAGIPPLVAMMGPVPEGERTPDGPELQIGLMPVGMFQTEEAGSRGKDFVSFVLQSMASQPDVLVAGYISEAWLSTVTRGADGNPIKTQRPSEDPNRKECIILTLLSADCQAMQVCPVVRKDGGAAMQIDPMQFQGEGAQRFFGRFLRESPTLN